MQKYKLLVDWHYFETENELWLIPKGTEASFDEGGRFVFENGSARVSFNYKQIQIGIGCLFEEITVGPDEVGLPSRIKVIKSVLHLVQGMEFTKRKDNDVYEFANKQYWEDYIKSMRGVYGLSEALIFNAYRIAPRVVEDNLGKYFERIPDDKTKSDFATVGYQHDDRYFTETELTDGSKIIDDYIKKGGEIKSGAEGKPDNIKDYYKTEHYVGIKDDAWDFKMAYRVKGNIVEVSEKLHKLSNGELFERYEMIEFAKHCLDYIYYSGVPCDKDRIEEINNQYVKWLKEKKKETLHDKETKLEAGPISAAIILGKEKKTGIKADNKKCSHEFLAIWNVIKDWDISRDKPSKNIAELMCKDGKSYTTASGSDVIDILDSLKGIMFNRKEIADYINYVMHRVGRRIQSFPEIFDTQYFKEWLKKNKS